MSKNSQITIVKNSLAGEIKCHVNRTSYEQLIKSINDSWPEWKKELCNDELIVSTNAEKLV